MYLKHTDICSLVVIVLELISSVSVGEQQFHSCCYPRGRLYAFWDTYTYEEHSCIELKVSGFIYDLVNTLYWDQCKMFFSGQSYGINLTLIPFHERHRETEKRGLRNSYLANIKTVRMWVFNFEQNLPSETDSHSDGQHAPIGLPILQGIRRFYYHVHKSTPLGQTELDGFSSASYILY